MKKVISFILAVIMAVSMTACGGQSGSQGSSAEPTPTPQPTPKVLSDTLAISMYDETSTVIDNEYTGLEFTPDDVWTVLDRDTVCRAYMKNVTGRQLEAMAAGELAQQAVVSDWAARNASGNVVAVTIINYEKAGITFEDYMELFVATNTKGSNIVSDKKTVILSGVEYQNFTAYSTDNVTDFCYKDRGDGHMIVVMSNLGTDCTPRYVHAFFNGGADTETNIANVPGLFELDTEKWRIINSDAVIEIDIPYEWSYYSRKAIADVNYFMTEDQLNNMRAEDFATLNEIFDIYMVNDDESTSVRISYLNRNQSNRYGMSAEELRQYYSDTSNTQASYSSTYGQKSFAGQDYYVAKIYYYSADRAFIYLFRELNDDYIVKVMISTDGDKNIDDICQIFDGENDTDMLIKRSEYVEGKYQFHNRHSDVRINILKGWERNDRPLLKTLYGGEMTQDKLDSWTDQDYMNATYIPDFAVTSEDQATILMVYYINLNKFSDEKTDIYKLYDTFVSSFEKSDRITVEKDNRYPRGGHNYMVYKATNAEGTQNVQFATAEISDDYAIMLTYITPSDGAVPDVTGLIHDPQ